MNIFVIDFWDPTYNGPRRTVGLFCTATEAEFAREEAEELLTDEQLDRGCFYSITEFQVGKLYV